ncbi:OLC1v1035560C1 [Oldenlandia corymbosa var. corymbosa]|uniref:OLC1v1035560C1 n=1 Tax=Oldenlandia corymbosa var. corymbosa TaxID=529605 RepID=A0AAV1CTY5_OLDCO|nr:OLC1v1035560C1 [Oldenlandia corymbosa var. corymbosa]
MNNDEDHSNHQNNTNNMKNMQSSEEEEEDPGAQNSKLSEQLDENSEDGGSDESAGNDGGEAVSGADKDNSIPATAEMDSGGSSAPQTLAMDTSTDHLSDVPVEYELHPFGSAKEFKKRLTLSNKEAPESNAEKTVQVQTQKVEEVPNGTRSSELSPTSVTQFTSSIPSPAPAEQNISTVQKRSISHIQEMEKRNSSDTEKLAIVSVQRATSPDGYNWRKYGQKQVKSPLGSRSYYRCTHADCYAKKIECSDQSNRVMEIVYKSHHSHDPPQKVNSSRGSKLASPIAPVNGIDSLVSPTADSVPSTSVDSVNETATAPESKQKESSQPQDIAETDVKEDHDDAPEPRKRLKKTGSSCSGSPPKAGKKEKFVVLAAGDVGISGDGYRWRKYGQKMVKGNPHPRNYYRCTSAGCPVRKHIEMAKDNSNASIIAYRGVHNHDMPVPKKRLGPPSAPVVAAAAPTSMNAMPVTKPEHVQNHESVIQRSVDCKGELKSQTVECGAEKAVDSTKTLLSIGFEIKPR